MPIVKVDLSDPVINHKDIVKQFKKSLLRPNKLHVIVKNFNNAHLLAINQLGYLFANNDFIALID